MPLWLAPGRYRVGGLNLRPGSQIVGVRGATHLLFTHGPSLVAAEHAETVSLPASSSTAPARSCLHVVASCI